MTVREICFVALLGFTTLAEGAELRPLCSTPIHIVRKVSDSISGRLAIVDEYCDGDRIVSVSGRVTIADYKIGEIREIDRQNGEWSVTTFADAAAAHAKRDRVAPKRDAPWTLKASALKPAFSPQATESYVAERMTAAGRVKVEIAIDRRTLLSRPALDALIGASYPDRPSDLRDAIVAAAAPPHSGHAATSSEPLYALPVDEIVTIEADGEEVFSRNSVIAVDAARVPAELLVVPPESRRVESRITRFAKELEQLDTPAPHP